MVISFDAEWCASIKIMPFVLTLDKDTRKEVSTPTSGST